METFSIQDGGVLPHSAVPTLRFQLRVESDEHVRALSLNVQVRIAATQRTYSNAEEEALRELFGSPEQWGRSLQSLHWTNLAVQVPAFSGSTLVDLLVTCTYDLEVTAAKYLAGLDGGEAPLEFLFSGTAFYGEPLQVRPIAWNAEAQYRLPVSVWREMMDRFFPNSAWVRLDRKTFGRLQAYRARNAYLNWDDTFEALLS
jgi:Family of unknown function (DUF6084)